MEKFFAAVRNMFNVPDLRRRILFTLGMLAVYRLGAHIGAPGINKARLDQVWHDVAGTLLGRATAPCPSGRRCVGHRRRPHRGDPPGKTGSIPGSSTANQAGLRCLACFLVSASAGQPLTIYPAVGWYASLTMPDAYVVAEIRRSRSGSSPAWKGLTPSPQM